MFPTSPRKFRSLLILPVLLSLTFLADGRRYESSTPVAVDDSFQVHGTTQLGNLLANDFDPDGDNIQFDSYGSLPQHGGLFGPNLAAPVMVRIPALSARIVLLIGFVTRRVRVPATRPSHLMSSIMPRPRATILSRYMA